MGLLGNIWGHNGAFERLCAPYLVDGWGLVVVRRGWGERVIMYTTKKWRKRMNVGGGGTVCGGVRRCNIWKTCEANEGGHVKRLGWHYVWFITAREQ